MSWSLLLVGRAEDVGGDRGAKSESAILRTSNVWVMMVVQTPVSGCGADGNVVRK